MFQSQPENQGQEASAAQWDSHRWKNSVVGSLIVNDPTLVQLKPKSDDAAPINMHRALLSFFSPDYFGAKIDPTAAQPQSFVVALDELNLTTVHGWFYHGRLFDTTHDARFRVYSLISIYTFAHHSKNLALRRDVINAIAQATHQERSYVFPTMRLLNDICDYLGYENPLCVFWLEFYAYHYDARMPVEPVEMAEGFKSLLITWKGEFARLGKSWGPCGCRQNVCMFHEHENNGGAEEQEATCGLGDGPLLQH